MVDYHVVCSMCGDVGFPDKLFRCSKCCNRFQHSYCSNYYSEASEPIEICDWCKSEEKIGKHGESSRKSGAENDGNRTANSDGRIKCNDHDKNSSDERIKYNDHDKGSTDRRPSARTTTRRYKLLKDVMC